MMQPIELMVAIEPLHKLEPRHVAQIEAVSPRLSVRVAHTHAEMKRWLAETVILAGLDAEFRPEESPRLQWVQWWGAGMDHARFPDDWIWSSDMLFTNVKGIHGEPIAEFVLAQMVGWCRGFPQMARNQMQHRWGREDFVAPKRRELVGQRVGIVGYGNIGEAIARLALAFGMEVVATRRTASAAYESGTVQVLPPAGLPELLKSSDFVILALPLTQESRHLIGEAELKLMKPSGCLVNIARGPVIDEAALIAALREGRIGGAILDALTQEPLSADNPLWALPNVIITPHMSADTALYNDRATALFCDNLSRFLDGRELRNVVDKHWRY